MDIRLFHSCSVPTWINSPDLHVRATCFIHEVINMDRYVLTTYRLLDLKLNEYF